MNRVKWLDPFCLWRDFLLQVQVEFTRLERAIHGEFVQLGGFVMDLHEMSLKTLKFLWRGFKWLINAPGDVHHLHKTIIITALSSPSHHLHFAAFHSDQTGAHTPAEYGADQPEAALQV